MSTRFRERFEKSTTAGHSKGIWKLNLGKYRISGMWTPWPRSPWPLYWGILAELPKTNEYMSCRRTPTVSRNGHFLRDIQRKAMLTRRAMDT